MSKRTNMRILITTDKAGWRERQIAQVRAFIERDVERLKRTPDDLAVQLSLNSWRHELDTLTCDAAKGDHP